MLTDKALWAIRAMPRSLKTDYVFYGSTGAGRWYNCRKPWVAARTAAEVPWLRVHDLRQAFGIKLAESGCPMRDIQYVMGHSSVTTTERYYSKYSPDSSPAVVVAYQEGHGHRLGTMAG
jgi:integrase